MILRLADGRRLHGSPVRIVRALQERDPAAQPGESVVAFVERAVMRAAAMGRDIYPNGKTGRQLAGSLINEWVRVGLAWAEDEN